MPQVSRQPARTPAPSTTPPTSAPASGAQNPVQATGAAAGNAAAQGALEEEAPMSEEEANAELQEIEGQAESAPHPEVEEEEPAVEEAEVGVEEESGGEGDGEGDAGSGGEGDGGPPACSASDFLPGYGDVSGTLLSKYGSEKAWHDNWRTEGNPTGMSHSDRWALIGQALGSGGIEGLTNAASSLIVDTLLNKATRNIPYASGFIAMGEIFYKGPSAWLEEQGAATGGKLAEGFMKTFGEGADIVTRLEGVVDMLDGVNNIIGLASTICMIFAAAGFIISFFFPALFPFVALCAKWGLLLGKISTVVGIGITALRAILMLARIAQIAASDADPETQMERAQALRNTTAQWTQEWSTRQANNRLRERAERNAAERNRDASPQGSAPAGGDGGAQQRVGELNNQRTSRLDRIGQVLGGGSIQRGVGEVRAENNQRRDLATAIRDNQGEARVDAMRAASPDVMTEGTERRLRNHYQREAAREQVATSTAAAARATQANDAARAESRAAAERLEEQRRRSAEADDDYARARAAHDAVDPQQVQREVAARRESTQAGEQRVTELQREVTLAEARVQGQERMIATERARIAAIEQSDPDGASAARMALISRREELMRLEHGAQDTRNRLQAAQENLGVEQSQLRSAEVTLQAHQSGSLPAQTEAQMLAQRGALEAREAEYRSAQDRHFEAGGAETRAGEAMNEANANAASASNRASLANRLRDTGGDIVAAASDTAGGFTPGRLGESAAGNQTPADGYGHQGTGGALGQATPLLVKTEEEGGLGNPLADARSAANQAMTGWAGGLASGERGQAQTAEHVESLRANMDSGFRSMAATLPAPPEEKESEMQAAAERYNQIQIELAEIECQLEFTFALEEEAAVEAEALEQMGAMTEANSEAIVEHEGDIESRRESQEEVQGQLDASRDEAGEAGAAQGGIVGAALGFVTRFGNLCGMIPSRVTRRGVEAQGRIQEVADAINGIGESAQGGTQAAGEGEALVGEMGAMADQAENLTTEASGETEALTADFATSLSETQAGQGELSEAGTTAQDRIAQLEAQRAVEQAAYEQALGGMQGWAVNHESLRTTGESRIVEDMASLDAQLAAHEAMSGGQ